MNFKERLKRDGYTHDEIESAVHDLESRADNERNEHPRASTWPFPSRDFNHPRPSALRFNINNIEDARL